MIQGVAGLIGIDVSRSEEEGGDERCHGQTCFKGEKHPLCIRNPVVRLLPLGIFGGGGMHRDLGIKILELRQKHNWKC